MTYEVEIAGWHGSKPLIMTGVEATSGEEAYQKTVDWVNRYAGYHYCDRLPEGSRVFSGNDLVEICHTPIVVKS